MENVGIYTIICNTSKKIYVGSSNNIHVRILKHKNELKLGKHRNPHLQYSYNKYGSDDFKYEILENCNEEYLLYIESFWINILDTYNSNKGYNINNPLHGGEPTLKKIDVYSLDGALIKTYPSIKRVSSDLQVSNHSVSKVCVGKYKQTKGFVFRYHGDEFAKYDYIHSHKPLPVCNVMVDQISISGVYIKTYNSVKEAARSVNMSSSSISRAINKCYPTGGYIWDKHNSLRITDSSLTHVQPKRYNALCKKIDQYCENGVYIKTWSDAKEIALTYHCCTSLIRKVCSGVNKTAKGYKWKYKND